MSLRRSTRVKAQTTPSQDSDQSSDLSDVEESERGQDDVEGEEEQATEEEEDGDDDEFVVRKTSQRGRGRSKQTGQRVERKKGGGRKKKVVVGGADLHIEMDNALWNVVAATNASITTAVEDWVSSLQSEEEESDEVGGSMATLISFVLRCCGCNASIDRYEAVDVDGIVDKLDDIQTAQMAAPDFGYPLIHKKPPLSKIFRPNLSEFFQTLLSTLHSTDLLHTSSFIDVFSAWLVSLSSSGLRSFRHTSTVLALLFVEGLCTVGEEVGTELRKASVARENEEKRLEGLRGRKNKERLREFQKRAEEADERKNRVEEACREIFDSVFLHRYHDTDPLVRLDCVTSLGKWMQAYPSFWIEQSYLRYIGWLLSDISPLVRLAAINSLNSVYALTDYIGLLGHFTERFKGQIVDMAVGEVEPGVRIKALDVLDKIDGLGMLEDEQRDEIAVLVFEKDARVREGASKCWARLVREEVDERTIGLEAMESPRKGKKGKGRTREERVRRLTFKVLAQLLAKYTSDLDRKLEEVDHDAEMVKFHQNVTRGRIALAVESLWDADGLEAIKEWEPLVAYLQADHSMSTEQALSPSKSKRSGEDGEEEPVEEGCKLEDEEEGIMIEVLVASLQRTMTDEKKGKDKRMEDETRNEITRALMSALPRLLEKHKTAETRVAELLVLLQIMNLELYLDMRMISSYEQLWDDIIAQFLRHNEPIVLQRAAFAIRALLSTITLSATNDTKILELEDTLFSSLRQSLNGIEEVATAQFEDDEIQKLEGEVRRIGVFQKIKDITEGLETGVEGQMSSLWELVDGLAERGRLGYREEEDIVKESLDVLTVHLIWKLRELKIKNKEKEKLDNDEVESFNGIRNRLVERLMEFALETTSNILDGVKRTAFIHLMTIHSILSPESSTPEDLTLECDGETQTKCAEFVKAEVDTVAEDILAVDDEVAEDEDEDDQGEDVEKDKEKKKKKELELVAVGSGRKHLNSLKVEYLLNEVVTSFVKASQIGVFNCSQSTSLFPYFHVLNTPFFDQCCKMLADDMKQSALYGGEDDTVAQIVIDSLQTLCENLYVEGRVKDEKDILQLSKLFGSTIIVRGPSLSIVKKLKSESLVRIHLEMMKWAIQKTIDLDKEDELLALPGRIRENKKKRDIKRSRITAFVFKSLLNLVAGMTGKEALKIKSALDAVVMEKKLAVSKGHFEPLRQYEKRLITILSKDKTIKSALAKRKAGASDAEMSSEAEPDRSDVDPFTAADDIVATAKASKARATKEKAKEKKEQSARRKRKRDVEDVEGEGGDEEPKRKRAAKGKGRSKKKTESTKKRKKERTGEEEPKERRRSSRTRTETSYREAEEEGDEPASEEEEEELTTPESETNESDREVETRVTRKRKRVVQEEDEMEERLKDMTNGTGVNGNSEKPSSQTSNMSLSEIKRKRRKKK